MEDYTVCGKIGNGAEGVVYRVRHVPSNKELAMKVIRCADQSRVNVALKEIKVLLHLRHQHVVSYVDFFLVFQNDKMLHEFTTTNKNEAHLSESTQNLRIFSTTGSSTASTDMLGSSSSQCGLFNVHPSEVCVCLVMELCTSGDVQDTIRQAKQRFMETGSHPISEAQVLSWMEQCASALNFIHSQGFLHRDLKPTNIFFDDNKDVKIGDFGLAATVGLGRQSIVGTPLYLAPERMLHQVYDEKVDVWGLGVAMLELVTLSEQPINSRVLENPLIVESVVQQVTNLGFSTKLGCLLRDMLQRFPEARPSPAAILRRLIGMTSNTPRMSTSSPSLFAGMSCPKCPSNVCELCEVEPAIMACSSCNAAFCEGCDRARHRHQSRQSHERTSLIFGRSGQATQAHLLNDMTEMNSNVLPPLTSKHSRLTNTFSQPFSRLIFPTFRPGCSVSLSSTTETSSNVVMNSIRNTVIRVPQDYPSIHAALSAASTLPYIRKILVASNAIHNTPLLLTDALPDNIKIVGENPSPVIETNDALFAIHCSSGRGTVENFIIRQAGRRVSTKDSHAGDKPIKKTSRPIAVSITGGEWKITKCRISCSGGSGISVATDVEAVVSQCMILEVKTAGVIVLEGGRGLFEKNTFTNCEYAAFLLKKNSSARIRGNYVQDGLESGIFCQDASGLVEDNFIANNAGCGVVTKGSDVNTIFRGNRVVANGQAGFFCCDNSAPIITGNEVRQNKRAGILIKTRASPKITKNVIRNGKEAGIYIFEGGSGFIEENEVLENQNAGILVTSHGSPHVIKNVIRGNLYEGVWVCKDGGGTFFQNDLRRNEKGAKDIEKGCAVVWIGNEEEVK